MRPISPDAVMQHLQSLASSAPDAVVYTIVDAARDERIYPGLMQSTRAEDRVCLYRGDIPLPLAEVAPYLVQLHPAAPVTHWLLSSGWGESWGIFCISAAPFGDLYRHLRRFLMVYDEAGKPLYFRYYDPRVFRLYLPTCNAQELPILFGPVSHYCLESEESTALHVYSCGQGQLLQQVIPLTPS